METQLRDMGTRHGVRGCIIIYHHHHHQPPAVDMAGVDHLGGGEGGVVAVESIHLLLIIYPVHEYWPQISSN